MFADCWDDQPFVLRLSSHLQELGVKVWVDVESMSGSTLEAMADAVENAYAVIVVLSDACTYSHTLRPYYYLHNRCLK